jgi:hypothetical protein
MTVAKTLSEKLKDCDYRVKLDTKSKPASCAEAINNAKYAIVILSPAFFQDEHAMGVLERLICRQLNRGERFILPLWHEVDERQVFESWPQMCDIFGLKTSIGVPAIVREFRNKIIHVSCPSLVLSFSLNFVSIISIFILTQFGFIDGLPRQSSLRL